MRLEDMVGLDVLVGLTYLDAEGSVLRQEQFHGVIEDADPSTTWIRPSDGGDRRWVPAAGRPGGVPPRARRHLPPGRDRPGRERPVPPHLVDAHRLARRGW
jgi:hypothetical protein